LSNALWFDTGSVILFSATICRVHRWNDSGDQTEMTTHNMDDAQKTYGSFMSALKWSVPLIAVIVFFVIMLIA